MAGSHTPGKRKSPPPVGSAASSHNKRQRLDSPPSGPPSQSTFSAINSPVESVGSLSSLSDGSPSHPSSPEVGLSQVAAQHRAAAESLDIDAEDDDDSDEPLAAMSGAGKTRPGASLMEDSAPPEGDDEDEDGEGELEELPLDHPNVSAKTVPGQQPTAAKKGPASNGTGPLRPTVGGKGQRGEDALEHAVAAREEVERRRVELKGPGAKKAPPGSAATVKIVQKTPKVAQPERFGDGEVKVKLEEEEPTVEAGEDESAVPVKRERPAITEERQNIIRFVVVTNDQTPESLIILTGLKNIFQKQLPKMPREYIARLVYDRNHYSMAIVKRGLEVVGGVTYRPFEARRFAEIVFFAITGTEQVKGYGSHLMNHLKDHVKAATACMHFLTYADNYAIGYFKKQGFTKEVGLDRSVWAGYIKDYEGGTIMHCSMLERIRYLEVASILLKQKEVILAQIRQKSQSHVVHAGLPLHLFQTLGVDQSIDPSLVPGLKGSGWTPEMDALTRRPVRGPHFAIMKRLHVQLTDHPSAWAFAQPVNGAEVTDYYRVITSPMDLSTMESKLESNLYSTLSEFAHDAKLIFDNCRAYNDAGSNYVKNANKLEAFLNEQLKLYDMD